MDVVIDLGRVEFPRVVCDRMQSVVFANLREDGTERVVAGVGLDNRRLIRQKVGQDRRLTKLPFQVLDVTAPAVMPRHSVEPRGAWVVRCAASSVDRLDPGASPGL